MCCVVILDVELWTIGAVIFVVPGNEAVVVSANVVVVKVVSRRLVDSGDNVAVGVVEDEPGGVNDLVEMPSVDGAGAIKAVDVAVGDVEDDVVLLDLGSEVVNLRAVVTVAVFSNVVVVSTISDVVVVVVNIVVE